MDRTGFKIDLKFTQIYPMQSVQKTVVDGKYIPSINHSVILMKLFKFT